jgi:hypothetical protein
MTDDVQKHNNCVNIPSSQTFRSWKYTFIYVVALFETSEAAEGSSWRQQAFCIQYYKGRKMLIWHDEAPSTIPFFRNSAMFRPSYPCCSPVFCMLSACASLKAKILFIFALAHKLLVCGCREASAPVFSRCNKSR